MLAYERSPVGQLFSLAPGLPGSRAAVFQEMFGIPSRLPGARTSAASYGMFGLGQEDKGTSWLTIILGVVATGAVVGLAYCLLSGKKPQARGMTLGEARQKAQKAAQACC